MSETIVPLWSGSVSAGAGSPGFNRRGVDDVRAGDDEGTGMNLTLPGADEGVETGFVLVH
ncbi:hypothetical protein [Corynebacterium marambiense]|uniref:hypothetical protein n=1 Tax=Corynebacterium marambiense TaxID=2765364 RepID=UPI001E613448|nr:hypothetical protein [Corynebacterium marambiense]